MLGSAKKDTQAIQSTKRQLQAIQSTILRLVTDAPQYDTNLTLPTDLEKPFVVR